MCPEIPRIQAKGTATVKMNHFLEIREDPSEPLFHYTSVSSLQNILESKSLWATDIQYMNDSQELRHGIKVLDQLLVERIPELPEKQSKCAIQFRQWIAHGAISQHHIFVACLTADGNLLSQWRSYCTPGKGVSFSFSPDELVDVVYDQGFKLSRVEYSRDEQTTMMGYLIDSLMEASRIYIEPGPDEIHPTQSFFKLFFEWEDRFIHLCAMMKHPAFSDEEEWRAISTPIKNLQDDRLQFRDGEFSLTPYIELMLPKNGKDAVSIQDVFVGPTPNHNLAFRAIGSLLTSEQASPRDGIHASGIPLRT